MTRRVLITGGAGFIGSHLAGELIRRGDRVRVLDALVPQVHGPACVRPAYLAPAAELVIGDVRDPDDVKRALEGADVVVHFAARVGVGQSMYEVVDYTSVNTLGTAVLLEAMIGKPITRLVVASSMSVYGEGLYLDADDRAHVAAHRTREQLARSDFELHAPDGRALHPVPTPETKPPALASIYALSKYDQERMCLVTGAAYELPAVALRFFNVYGPHQALSNPYTGVLANFASRLLNDKAPIVFEDGKQRRDFVHVRDVVAACCLAIDSPDAVGHAINIGSGRGVTVLDVARRIARVLGKSIEPDVTGKVRSGDVRHCTADISLAQRVLGYRPAVELEAGLDELAGWLRTQTAIDRAETMQHELARRGLTS